MLRLYQHEKHQLTLQAQDLCLKQDELLQHGTELGNMIVTLCTAVAAQERRNKDRDQAIEAKLDKIMEIIQSNRSAN